MQCNSRIWSYQTGTFKKVQFTYLGKLIKKIDGERESIKRIKWTFQN